MGDGTAGVTPPYIPALHGHSRAWPRRVLAGVGLAAKPQGHPVTALLSAALTEPGDRQLLPRASTFTNTHSVIQQTLPDCLLSARTVLGATAQGGPDMTPVPRESPSSRETDRQIGDGQLPRSVEGCWPM